MTNQHKSTGLDFMEAQTRSILKGFESGLESVSNDRLARWNDIVNSDFVEYIEKRLDDMLTVMAIRTVNPGKGNGSAPTVEERGIRAICMEGVIEGANLWRSVIESIRNICKRRNAAASFEPSTPLRRSGIRSPSEAAADARRILGESEWEQG